MLEREEAPTLYRLADEVADALETRRIDRIVVDSEFNAYWSVGGLRRTRVVGLGLPLVWTLDPQELVALMAHELAHARNGDATRGIIIGSAINTLAEIYNALEGSGRSIVQSEESALLELVSRPLTWLLARPVLGLLYAEFLLLRRDSQRAEYLADALAADVAGTAAVVEFQQSLLNGPTVASVIQRAARDGTTDLFGSLRAATDAIPERERERRRRVARLEGARLTATHPPTGRRLDLLERRGAAAPKVELDDARAAEIRDELVERCEQLTAQLIDDHRASLY
jgi:heat shock protein HtpX